MSTRLVDGAVDGSLRATLDRLKEGSHNVIEGPGRAIPHCRAEMPPNIRSNNSRM